MPTRRQPVQPLRRAEMIAAKVTPMQVRGPRWQRVGPGLYVPWWVHANHPDQRIVSAAARLSNGGAVGGWGAARRLGAGMFDGRGWDGKTLLPVPLLPGPDHQIRRDSAIDVWADALDESEIVDIFGVPVTTAPRTCFGGVRRAASLVDAVAFADVMLHAELVELGRMQGYVARRQGWRGVPQARRALELADARSRNPWESRFRMAWMLDAGLPRPLCNWPVFDLSGNLLGYPDLLDPDAGTVGEYDGKGHRELAQHGADNAREEAFESHGLVVTRAVSLDFADQDGLADRLRRAHARGMRRDRGEDRWTLDAPHDWGAMGAEHELDALLDSVEARSQA